MMKILKVVLVSVIISCAYCEQLDEQEKKDSKQKKDLPLSFVNRWKKSLGEKKLPPSFLNGNFRREKDNDPRHLNFFLHPKVKYDYPGLHDNYPAPHDNYPGLHDSYPGLHDNYPGLHDNYPGLHDSYPGLHDNYPGLHDNYPGLHDSYPAPHDNYPAPHDNYPGLHDSYPGLHDYYPGLLLKHPGLKHPGVKHPGLHDKHPGLHDEIASRILLERGNNRKEEDIPIEVYNHRKQELKNDNLPLSFINGGGWNGDQRSDDKLMNGNICKRALELCNGEMQKRATMKNTNTNAANAKDDKKTA